MALPSVRAAALVFAIGAATCTRERASHPPDAERPAAAPASAAATPASPIVETIYDGALGKGWSDWGWSPRKVGSGPAEIDLSKFGGWILARPGFNGSYGALVFRVATPAEYGDFLEVRLHSNNKGDEFPPVLLGAAHRTPLTDGWSEIVVPMSALDPDDLAFDRVVIRAYKNVGDARIRIDKIGLTAQPPRPITVADAELVIECRGQATPVSPLIYGIAYDPRLDAHDKQQWKLGATARRWGGNPASRYNWELGNAWNTANDWFWENINYTGIATYSYADFLSQDLDHGVQTALTVPILGWVAKDTRSNGFPVSEVGPQRAVDPYRPDAGDGRRASGDPLPAGPPTRTSVAAPPESIRRWVERIRAEDQRRGRRSVDLYILDNEPMLWSSTHRDVHPDPTSYDEILDRTIRYGAAIRAADPDARIAGPAEWGWPAYFFSAKDAAGGFSLKLDRRAHGDVPLLAWYLRKLREHEQKTGVRVLDVLDVHFYPQADHVGGKDGGVDSRTAALRIRSTRALWDPSYLDESWIHDTIQLIPRMKQLILESYPGLGFAIGEYNFGAEEVQSGGLALAEALGRFGQGGVTAAFYWTYPPDRSPAFWAFRAYRDFDGHGARFLDFALPTTAPEGTSLFASRDGGGTHVVAVLLNLRAHHAVRPRVVLSGCGPVTSLRALRYAGGPDGFVPTEASSAGGPVTLETVPPSSITVLDLQVEAKP